MKQYQEEAIEAVRRALDEGDAVIVHLRSRICHALINYMDTQPTHQERADQMVYALLPDAGQDTPNPGPTLATQATIDLLDEACSYAALQEHAEAMHNQAEAYKTERDEAYQLLRDVRPYATRWFEKMEAFVLEPFDGNKKLPKFVSEASLKMYNFYRGMRETIDKRMADMLDTREPKADFDIVETHTGHTHLTRAGHLATMCNRVPAYDFASRNPYDWSPNDELCQKCFKAATDGLD